MSDRRSDLLRRELAGSYTFAIAIAIALFLASSDNLVVLTWAAVQVVRSLCSARVAAHLPALVLDAEEWAWRAWAENDVDDVSSPQPVLEYTPAEFSAMSEPPLDRPWVARGLLNGTALHRKWTTAWLSESPGRGDQQVSYFSDARRALIVPDARGPLRDVLAMIAAGGPQKLGTEMVFRAEVDAVGDLAELQLTRQLGASYFRPEMLGTILTMPLFVARGFAGETTRTDLHCEPIANAVLQLEGSKIWTLMGPEHSRLVAPQVSPDGRAYFYTRLDHASPRFKALPRQVTYAGDVIFVPTWQVRATTRLSRGQAQPKLTASSAHIAPPCSSALMALLRAKWHRVDYVQDVVSVSVSLFHFRPRSFAFNHPLFSLLIVPNLLKEAIGLNKQ